MHYLGTNVCLFKGYRSSDSFCKKKSSESVLLGLSFKILCEFILSNKMPVVLRT